MAEHGLKQARTSEADHDCEIRPRTATDDFLKISMVLERIQRPDQAHPGAAPRLGLVANTFDERDPAGKMLLAMAISSANKAGKYIGICGQGPSDHPDLAEWLMDQGISSISLNPDTVVDTWTRLATHKKG